VESKNELMEAKSRMAVAGDWGKWGDVQHGDYS